MSGFRWNKAKTAAAIALADGETVENSAKLSGVVERTIFRWKDDIEFSSEVDRLTLMMGISAKAERLRIAKRVIKQKVEKDRIKTEKDLLDWIKYAQSETDGVKLDLTGLLAAFTSDDAPMAGSGSEGVHGAKGDTK